MPSLTKQSGITLIAAILLALAAAALSALFSSWYAGNAIQHATRCETDLIRMQSYDQAYRQSVASGSPDKALCQQLNSRVDQYNKTCGDDFGMLPKLECPL